MLTITNRILTSLINKTNLDRIYNKTSLGKTSCKTSINQMDKVLKLIKWVDRGCKLNRISKNLKITDRIINVKVSNKFLNNKSNNNNKIIFQTKMVKYPLKINTKIVTTQLFN